MIVDENAYKAIRLSRDGKLMTVRLDNPGRLNAISPDMHDELVQFFYEVAEDDSVCAILFTGTGDRAFCAGADTKRMHGNLKADDDGSYQHRRAIRSMIPAKRILGNMLQVEQPIVGAINGDAIGLGATLALGCDIVVANKNARFADTHVKNLAVSAGDGGTVVWPMGLGIHKAMEYLLTGDYLCATDAERAGLVNYALEPDEVLPKAVEIATRLANGPAWPTRWTKAAVNKIARQQYELTLDFARATEQLCFITNDHKEAVSAYREKRPASFTND